MSRLPPRLGAACGYVLVFLALLFLSSVAQPVDSAGGGKLLSWLFGFLFLAIIAAPVIAITALVLGIFRPCKKQPSSVWIAAAVAAVGAAALPMIAGLYTERACGWRPMDWIACADAAYAASSDGLKVGYLIAGAQVLAVVIICAVLLGWPSRNKDSRR